MTLRADDNVVEDFDLHHLAGADQIAGDFDVRFRWCGISRYAVCSITGVIPYPILCRMAYDFPGFPLGEPLSDTA